MNGRNAKHAEPAEEYFHKRAAVALADGAGEEVDVQVGGIRLDVGAWVDPIVDAAFHPRVLGGVLGWGRWVELPKDGEPLFLATQAKCLGIPRAQDIAARPPIAGKDKAEVAFQNGVGAGEIVAEYPRVLVGAARVVSAIGREGADIVHGTEVAGVKGSDLVFHYSSFAILSILSACRQALIGSAHDSTVPA